MEDFEGFLCYLCAAIGNRDSFLLLCQLPTEKDDRTRLRINRNPFTVWSCHRKNYMILSKNGVLLFSQIKRIVIGHCCKSWQTQPEWQSQRMASLCALKNCSLLTWWC